MLKYIGLSQQLKKGLIANFRVASVWIVEMYIMAYLAEGYNSSARLSRYTLNQNYMVECK